MPQHDPTDKIEALLMQKPSEIPDNGFSKATIRRIKYSHVIRKLILTSTLFVGGLIAYQLSDVAALVTFGNAFAAAVEPIASAMDITDIRLGPSVGITLAMLMGLTGFMWVLERN